MPGKAKMIPAPIDRPLSRAYLRQFTGWASAYPPGMSDPASLREMENVSTNRDGSVRIRPGLRFISYRSSASDPRLALDLPTVGTHEPFFLADGSKAYLFAVREADGTVDFRVLATVDGVQSVYHLPAVGFEIDEDAGDLEFSAETTYVKYLQIDNKIFALSNAGEPFRYFTVGETKTAKRLNSISLPDWDPDDKLTVVHPEQAWVLADEPTYQRYNRIVSPSMGSLSGWQHNAGTKLTQTDVVAHEGNWGAAIESWPERTNLCVQPLHSTSTVTKDGWDAGAEVDGLSIVNNALSAHAPAGKVDRRIFVNAPEIGLITPLESYQVAFTVVDQPTGMQGIVRWRWFTAAGAPIGALIDRAFDLKVGRHVIANMVAPKGAATMQLFIGGYATTVDAKIYSFNNVLVSQRDEPSTMFSGNSGANYFWTNETGYSRSVYHPPQDLRLFTRVTPRTTETPGSWVASIYVQAKTAVGACRVDISWRNKDDKIIETVAGVPVNDAVGTWTRVSLADVIPPKATEAVVSLNIPGVPRGQVHYVDSALFEGGTVPDAFFSGATVDTPTTHNEWLGEPQFSVSKQEVFSHDRGIPDPAVPTGATLISDDPDKNVYSFGFFYTISNEIGESAASQVTVVQTRRGWNQWKWERPNAAAENSGTPASHPGMCADQLVAIMPKEVFNAATDQGATGWNLYVFTWSDQQPVPVTAMLGDSRVIDKESHPYSTNGWLGITPSLPDTADITVLPNLANRFNYSDPGAPAQGLVAADRMVLVGDRTNSARIRWSSAQQGHYTDFSAHRGGGYKTLTSGNLFIPAAVKLWQNPQSVDTITILCEGTDGYSTGYYMAPAQIASQTEATNIMGFEETTATPGTTSPYGVEVLNNALYHPLDEMLMKSTANNYNISHKSITDLIANSWRSLQAKHRIVSCQHDNRLYYLVNNPLGAEMPEGCFGNEVWVYDTGLGSDKGTWSRWLTPGCSLRKIEQGNRVYMSLVHPDGIFYFDEYAALDEWVEPTTKRVYERAIPWKIRTNTQGANRAHDAWCHLQQLNLYSGNFSGTMRYGIRSWDVNGKPVDVSKVMVDVNPVESAMTFDVDDYLQIRRDLREWSFFAESVLDDGGVVLPSYGQVSMVQYRYTPVSVNVGYEFGSVETFEYANAPETVSNGVPIPYVDLRRP